MQSVGFLFKVGPYTLYLRTWALGSCIHVPYKVAESKVVSAALAEDIQVPCEGGLPITAPSDEGFIQTCHGFIVGAQFSWHVALKIV